MPRLTWLPVRMRRLPVPDACLQLAHGAILGSEGRVGTAILRRQGPVATILW